MVCPEATQEDIQRIEAAYWQAHHARSGQEAADADALYAHALHCAVDVPRDVLAQMEKER